VKPLEIPKFLSKKIVIEVSNTCAEINDKIANIPRGVTTEELKLPTLQGKSFHIYLINEPNGSLSNDCKH